jgi:hypothetical protein
MKDRLSGDTDKPSQVGRTSGKTVFVTPAVKLRNFAESSGCPHYGRVRLLTMGAYQTYLPWRAPGKAGVRVFRTQLILPRNFRAGIQGAHGGDLQIATVDSSSCRRRAVGRAAQPACAVSSLPPEVILSPVWLAPSVREGSLLPTQEPARPGFPVNFQGIGTGPSPSGTRFATRGGGAGGRAARLRRLKMIPLSLAGWNALHWSRMALAAVLVDMFFKGAVRGSLDISRYPQCCG